MGSFDASLVEQKQQQQQLRQRRQWPKRLQQKCHQQRPDQCGTGFGGVITARDDFVAQRRRTKWGTQAGGVPVPPRLYLDNKTIIREVTDLSELRQGDHCLITINLIRSVSPTLDSWISYLGSLELIYFYHHFIIMDDVAHVDDQGIPRTKTGKMAEIMEYGNTLPEAYKEVKEATAGSFLAWPTEAMRFILSRKSKCHFMPLADYGDTPHIYVVVEDLTKEDRARIIKDAAYIVQHPAKYHFFTSNCEHITNSISRGRFTSPNVDFVKWASCRSLLCCIGLVILSFAVRSCYNKICLSYPVGAMIAYYFFSSVPVVAQAVVSYVQIVQSVCRQYAKALITHDDYCHLLGKELARMVVVGGGATTATVLVPHLVTRTQCMITVCGMGFLAYMVSDIVYNLIVHAVMRLVLLPYWGKVWLIGHPGENAKMD